MNETKVYSMNNPNVLPVYDEWRNGTLDQYFQGFGKKVMQKMKKWMGVKRDIDKFKHNALNSISSVFDAVRYLPPRFVNYTRLRSANQSQQSQTSSSNFRGELLIDGGCDTTLVGKGFKIESTTARSVNVQGFSEKMTIDKLPIVTAITAIDLPETTLILEFNECIHVENNAVSLMSTFQARENSVDVYDVTRRHGGKQSIMVDNYEIPLSVRSGLLLFFDKSNEVHQFSQSICKQCKNVEEIQIWCRNPEGFLDICQIIILRDALCTPLLITKNIKDKNKRTHTAHSLLFVQHSAFSVPTLWERVR